MLRHKTIALAACWKVLCSLAHPHLSNARHNRYIAAGDNAVAACWWVTDVLQYVLDDGNSNENLYTMDARQDWITLYDGVVENGYFTAGPYTLDTCYSMCENGTWANCLGFSRCAPRGPYQSRLLRCVIHLTTLLDTVRRCYTTLRSSAVLVAVMQAYTCA